MEIKEITSITISIISVVIAILSYKRNVIKEHKQLSKEEGSFLSDIGYIKACVDRMEKKISNVDERYQDLLQRLTKVEENLINTQKRVEEIIISEYG
ncbi:MAG: hypothetical protein V8R16_02615 [Bacilli bacterium]